MHQSFEKFQCFGLPQNFHSSYIHMLHLIQKNIGIVLGELMYRNFLSIRNVSLQLLDVIRCRCDTQNIKHKLYLAWSIHLATRTLPCGMIQLIYRYATGYMGGKGGEVYLCGGSRGCSEGSVEPPFGSLISMKNTDLNVYFCSKVPFREFTNPPSQNPGSAPVSIDVQC